MVGGEDQVSQDIEQIDRATHVDKSHFRAIKVANDYIIRRRPCGRPISGVSARRSLAEVPDRVDRQRLEPNSLPPPTAAALALHIRFRYVRKRKSQQRNRVRDFTK